MESFWPKNQYSWCQLVFCQTTVASMNQPSKKKDLKLFLIGKLTSVQVTTQKPNWFACSQRKTLRQKFMRQNVLGHYASTSGKPLTFQLHQSSISKSIKLELIFLLWMVVWEINYYKFFKYNFSSFQLSDQLMLKLSESLPQKECNLKFMAGAFCLQPQNT